MRPLRPRPSSSSLATARYGTVSSTRQSFNTVPYHNSGIGMAIGGGSQRVLLLLDFHQNLGAGGDKARSPARVLLEREAFYLLAVAAQAIEVDDGQTAIFEPEQALFFQFLQTLVRVLPGDAGQRADFLLCDLQMPGQLRMDDRIEQRRNAARHATRRVQRAAVFEQTDEQAEPLVELADQVAIEGDAVFEQPDEGRAVHQGQACLAQRHNVIAAGLVFQDGALAKPGAGHHAGEGRGLAAARDDAHPGETADHADPIFEIVAAHEDVLVCAKRFLDDPGASDLDLPVTEFARPGRDATQMLPSDQTTLSPYKSSEKSLSIMLCCIAQ